jgi:hypothetical protein
VAAAVLVLSIPPTLMNKPPLRLTAGGVTSSAAWAGAAVANRTPATLTRNMDLRRVIIVLVECEEVCIAVLVRTQDLT